MVRAANVDTRGAAGRLLIGLVLFVIISAGTTIFVLTSITHDFYTSAYFAFTSLFDATGIDANSALSSVVPPFSSQFYIVVGLSVLDGITKIVIIGFLLAAIINVLTSIDLRSKFGGIVKKSMKNHVIICGYSSLAERLCTELTEKKIPFVVIEKDQTVADMIREEGRIVIHDDFASRAVLNMAMIANARAVVFLTENDFENLLGVVTAHHMNPNVKVIVRAGDDMTLTKMHRAGAELCVVPESLAGLDIGNYIVAKR